MMSIIQEAASGTTGEEVREGGGEMVYVVDDQKVVAELTAAVLQLKGYRTRIFHDPDQAFTAMDGDTNAPDLLMTDYQMGASTGLDLIERSKERHPTLRTILFSGTARRSVFADRAVKPDAFLEKPFIPDHLIDVVKSVLKA